MTAKKRTKPQCPSYPPWVPQALVQAYPDPSNTIYGESYCRLVTAQEMKKVWNTLARRADNIQASPEDFVMAVMRWREPPSPNTIFGMPDKQAEILAKKIGAQAGALVDSLRKAGLSKWNPAALLNDRMLNSAIEAAIGQYVDIGAVSLRRGGDALGVAYGIHHALEQAELGGIEGILKTLACRTLFNAKASARPKKPRDARAKVTFLVMMLSHYFRREFRTPLHETVAITVNTVFHLREPLSAARVAQITKQ